jgi:hypothetical protein
MERHSSRLINQPPLKTSLLSSREFEGRSARRKKQRNLTFQVPLLLLFRLYGF